MTGKDFSEHAERAACCSATGVTASPEGVDVSCGNRAVYLSATENPPKLLVLNACDPLEKAKVP